MNVQSEILVLLDSIENHQNVSTSIIISHMLAINQERSHEVLIFKEKNMYRVSIEF